MKKTLLLLLTALSLGAVEFPVPYNSEQDKSKAMLGTEAAAKMRLPLGFKATVFAAEPDVQNPIAMAWDARGRLWVAENYTYAESGKKFDLNLRDRILIFEDKDGDGRFDTRKVFTDEVQMLTSIEIGHGGVWVMCPPQLRFIPDRNGDDVPDGAPEVLLDGLTGSPDMHHTFANGLRFGPDGWLYGRCGASSTGEMGMPGTPAEQRIPLRGTMWRYHPRRKVVEALSSGTTNPWATIGMSTANFFSSTPSTAISGTASRAHTLSVPTRLTRIRAPTRSSISTQTTGTSTLARRGRIRATARPTLSAAATPTSG